MEFEMIADYHCVTAESPIWHPAGRVFSGIAPNNGLPGRLFRINPSGEYEIVVEGIEEPNGMGFSLDRKFFYRTETQKRTLFRYNYDQESGIISNSKVFVQVAEDDGVPDGMAVDAEGFIWSAHWGAGCLVRYAPDGSEDRRVTVPVAKVTCMAFGGEDYSDLYITSEGGNDRQQNGALAGTLLRTSLGIAGRPTYRSRIGLAEPVRSG